uniref:Uncharacterized protein n=1 Tax=Acrobeloides nanus TaxID=290746 RepID=A0A914CZU8_9BILA
MPRKMMNRPITLSEAKRVKMPQKMMNRPMTLSEAKRMKMPRKMVNQPMTLSEAKRMKMFSSMPRQQLTSQNHTNQAQKQWREYQQCLAKCKQQKSRVKIVAISL